MVAQMRIIPLMKIGNVNKKFIDIYYFLFIIIDQVFIMVFLKVILVIHS